MTPFKDIDVSHLKVSYSQCNLRELCFPHGMNDEELANMDAVVDQPTPLHKNDFLYGDNASALYAVRTGCIKTMTENANGEDKLLGFIWRVRFLAWMFLLTARIPVMLKHWKHQVYVNYLWIN